MVRNVITPCPRSLERISSQHGDSVKSGSSADSFKTVSSLYMHAAPPSCSPLYKVPIDQRRANPESFAPLLYSFGPYRAIYSDLYSSCEDGIVNAQDDIDVLLAEGENLKVSTATCLLKPDPDALFQRLVDEIEQRDAQDIQARYVQRRGNMVFKKLATILALDGIIMVAATLSREKQRLTPLIYPLARLVLSDAILLENQIPVLVLSRALGSITQSEIWRAPGVEAATDHVPSLEDVIDWYCTRASPFRRSWSLSNRSQTPLPARAVELRPGALEEPLLAFVYDDVTEQLKAPPISNYVVQPSPAPNIDEPSLPTASHLARCGVKFAPCTASSICIDSKAVILWLPKITVRVLHNLLAYEATEKHPDEYCLVSYVHFMDCLIDTAHDAQVLINAGVICNKLESVEELASKWNRLCISVSCNLTPSDKAVMAQMKAFSKQKWRRWRASFVEVYWKREPWLLISIVAATVLLVLAFLQTVFTIKK